MKFSCVIFFFVITIAAHFQRIQAFVSDELLHFKRALDDASNALQDVKESPAISGNVELQRQRRESIDDLLSNSQLDLNLDLEREALDLDNEYLHPLQGRATKNDNKSNNEKGATNVNVNDQLNELVRANSRFQNLHRQLLKSFHGSNSNLNLDMALQKAKAKDVVKSVSGTGTNDKNTNKDKDANRYSNSYKYKGNKNSNTGAGNSNKDTYNSDLNWKSDLGVKNNVDFDLDFSKDGSIETPYAQTFSKFDSPQSLNANANHKGAGLASSVLTKAYISCKPLSKNAGPTKTDNTYMEFTSNFHEPESNKESNAKSNLNSFLLLEANNYRNALRAKNIPNMDELQEVSEKKVDPEMHRMMQKVDFPQFRIDFDASMEDFARRSKSESADDDEPITYEKTIENIHFPNIVNDQFDLARNDLSHEANYKLSKVEQEQSEPRKEHAHSDENNVNTQEMDDKLKAPSKRSSDFNPMDEIKLKTSSRLMAKGFGPSLPSYALSETQHELQLDDAVKNLERNFNAESENNLKDSYRKGSLVSKDILDWQDRLARMDEVEEHSYEKLIYDGTPEASSKDESDSNRKTDEIVIEPTYTLLRKRKILQQPVEDDSHILDLMRARRVITNPSGDEKVLVQSSDADLPDDMLLVQLPDRTPIDENKNLAAEIPAPEVPAPEIPAQEDAADFGEVDDESPIEADVDALAEKFKRCGEQEDTNKSSDQTGAPSDRCDDVPNKMPIFKFKRDANKGEDSNAPRRRVKRIGVLNEAGEIAGIREVDLGALIDFMTVKELQPKREVVEKSKESVEEEPKARRSSRVDGINERKPLRPKVLRRHRRELSLTKDEVFNDDTLYVLNGSERMRRSVNKKEISRMRREAEKTETEKTAAEKTEAKVTKPEKVETSENRETRMSEPNTEQKADVKKSTTSDLKDANNTDHLMGKRAANIVDNIDDNSSNNRKLLDAALFLSDRGNSMPAHTFRDRPLAQRRAAVTQYGDNNSGNRRIMKAVSRFAGRSPPEISETLDDAAVIAADRRAMNAARAAYARNSARDGGDNEEAREEDYRDLMARLRRLSLQNRGHEADRENDFIKSVDEFGNQKFDNLKEVDQYAREFDGMPVDNLWYGSDPWEEDNNSDNNQQNDVPSEGSANKNRPIPQHTALTIKLEDGAIKSIERSDEQNKENEASVANEKTESEVEEDDGNNESAPFGWFGKSKNKADDAKCRDDGTVVKVNDQLLNCTAFNTLEEFLKSVQQQKNRTDSGKGVGGNASGGGSGNTISKGGRVEGSHGGGKQGSDGQEIGRQGTSGKGSGGHEGAGRGGDRQGTGGQEGGGHSGGGHGGGGHSGGSHSGDGHSGSGYGGGAKCGNDEQRTSGHEADGHADYGKYGNAKNGIGNNKKSGSGSGNSGNRDKEGGSGRDDYGTGGTGNGLGLAGSSCGTTGTDATPRPLGSSGQKAMKLNITINASVMGDQKAKNFFGNGTIKVQSEDRERRGISFPQITQLKRYAMKRKCAKPKTSSSCDENSIGGKGAMEIVKSIFDMVKCSPQMKPLWASLKRNQQCMKKVPPAESGFEKMQKDDANHIEDMVQQAMEAISDIIDDQVEQRSCLTLPPEMKVFYEQILDLFESNAAEGVREKRDNIDSPDSSIDEFSKEVRLIDPNQIEERSRIVKKLLRQYDDLPAEEQQQMVAVRDNLLQNLGFLESIKEDQTAKKREQAQQPPLEQPLEQEPEQQPEEPQTHEQHKVEETETDIQDRWRRELLKQMEDEKGDDEEALKAFNLPYTPEYLRLLKAAELMEEREIRESESRSGENEESGEVALIRQ